MSFHKGDVVRQIGHKDKLVVTGVVLAPNKATVYCKDRDGKFRAFDESDLQLVQRSEDVSRRG